MNSFNPLNVASLNKWGAWMRVFVCVMMCVSSVSCGEDKEESEEPPYLEIEKTELSFDKDGGTQTFVIKSNTSWRIEENEDWIVVSPAAQAGEAVISVTVEAQDEDAVRNGQLQIRYNDGSYQCRYISVIQTGVEINLEVDKKEIVLKGTIGDTAELTIQSNASWTISDKPSWLNLSTMEGKGTATVTMTTNSANKGTAEKSATMKIKSGGKTHDVIVRQEVGLAPISVLPDEMVVLYNNVAYNITVGSETKYFYYHIYAVSDLEGVSDKDLVFTLTRQEKKDVKDKDYVYWYSNKTFLAPETDYVFCSVGVDANGRIGDVSKTYFTTPAKSTTVMANIGNLSYESQWVWSVKRTSSCAGYYMVVYSEDYLYLNTLTTPDVYYAWLINHYRATGDVQYTSVDGSWTIASTHDECMVVTWGKDRFSGKMAVDISRKYGFKSSSYSQNKRTIPSPVEDKCCAPIPNPDDIQIYMR